MRGLRTVTYAEISDILCPKCKKVAEEALLLLPPFLREGFKENAYLTGSSLVQMLHDKPVKDYDFYFKDKEYAEKVKNFFIRLLYNYETDMNPFITIKRLAKFLNRGMKCDERSLNNMMYYLYGRIKEENIQIDIDCIRSES